MQTVSQMENFTGIFFHVMNDAVSLGYGLSALSTAVPSPPGSPPELLSFSQRRKGDLNSSEFPSLCFLWRGWRALCARVLARREPRRLACCSQNRQGCCPPAPGKAWEQVWGEPCSPILLCHAEWVRVGHLQAPLLPNFMKTGLHHALWFCSSVRDSSCGSLAVGLR